MIRPAVVKHIKINRNRKILHRNYYLYSNTLYTEWINLTITFKNVLEIKSAGLAAEKRIK